MMKTLCGQEELVRLCFCQRYGTICTAQLWLFSRGGDANMVSAKDVALIAKHLITDDSAVLTDSSRGSLTAVGQLFVTITQSYPDGSTTFSFKGRRIEDGLHRISWVLFRRNGSKIWS